MRAGVPVIEQGLLQARIDVRYLLIAQPNRLERRDVPSRLGAWSYAPIEIKTKRRSADAARLQLDVALWLLHTYLGMTTEGELWLGADAEGRPTVEKRAFDPAAIPAALDRLRALHGPARLVRRGLRRVPLGRVVHPRGAGARRSRSPARTEEGDCGGLARAGDNDGA